MIEIQLVLAHSDFVPLLILILSNLTLLSILLLIHIRAKSNLLRFICILMCFVGILANLSIDMVDQKLVNLIFKTSSLIYGYFLIQTIRKMK